MNEYNLSQIANNEMREFAMYTIESRAIPSMIDGLKPVQRFYLYSSIINTSANFKKVSAVSGVVSNYGYNHGETSAAGAGQLMAAAWNNNICLVEGRGSFGTRQIQAAGAARYVYTKLHANFKRHIKDVDLAPIHDDPEHSPPKFYIPVIPLVLANGAKGIATGFATNILPRSEKALIAACKEYIKTGKIKKRLGVSFPDFKGKTIYNETTDRFVCRGIYKRPVSTKVIITEIPYGYDREAYVKVLDKLDDDGDIISYEDQCSSVGFQFEVKLRNTTAKALNTDDKVIAKFKLEKSHSENLTVIGFDGKLREYKDERELIKDFVNFRNTILGARIDLRRKETAATCDWLQKKRDFINAVLTDEIVFLGMTKSNIISQIHDALVLVTDEDCERLLKLNILNLTKEMVDSLNDQIKKEEANFKYWEATDPAEQFSTDLGELK